MRISSRHYRSIWINGDPGIVNVIDQRKLPFEFKVFEIQRAEDAYFAIRNMVVRGARLIGVTASYGIYLAGFHSRGDDWQTDLKDAGELLLSSRPSVSNLRYAVAKMLGGVNFAGSRRGMIERLEYMANRMAESEVLRCREIGNHGLTLIKEMYKEKGRTINVLMYCNAGWLSSVDYGTATAPIFLAHDQGIPLHIWVDETRPRNLDARLTTFELREQGVPHTVIIENEVGHRMQKGEVDMVLVGSDHITPAGDVVAKVGTYMKALAARDNGIPFYVALASTPLDGRNGKRDGSKVEHAQDNKREEKRLICDRLRIMKRGDEGLSPDFDITPAHMVTGLITERGLCDASESAIKSLFRNSIII